MKRPPKPRHPVYRAADARRTLPRSSINTYQEAHYLTARLASILIYPSWAGFIDSCLNRPVYYPPLNRWYPEPGFITIGTLICSLACLLCAGYARRGDDVSLRWGLGLLVYAAPFFGMIQILGYH